MPEGLQQTRIHIGRTCNKYKRGLYYPRFCCIAMCFVTLTSFGDFYVTFASVNEQLSNLESADSYKILQNILYKRFAVMKLRPVLMSPLS